MANHTAALLAGGPELERAVRRAPDKWWALFNGPLECRLLLYQAR
jgi:hypothetical protein